MKKITLTNIRPPSKNPILTIQRKYQVFLNTDKNYFFNSKKDAKCFLAETNRKLNQSLHRINKNFADTYRIYRHLWFYFFDRDKFVNREKQEQNIRIHFTSAEINLNRSIHNTIGPNGNSFAFSFLINASNELLSALKILSEIAEIRNELVLKYEIETIKIQIETIKFELDKS
jgi:hypothetical protein